LIPWLVGSDYPALDPALRKALEVALHSGTLAALLASPNPDRLRLDPRELRFVALATAPAGLAGVLVERVIERRFGTPATISLGLLVGGVALIVADRCPQERRAQDAKTSDALWLGLAQAMALVPGVSRGGATIAMARSRRFRRRDANALSLRLALPVITGATVLKAWRVRQTPELAEAAPELAAGALASFLSARLAAGILGDERHERPLAGYGLYRFGLAALAVLRLRWPVRGETRLGQDAHNQGHAASL
jgi:undecaprenyl-diphosphatase